MSSRKTRGSLSLRVDDVIFDLPPSKRLPAAMEMLGVDYATLSENAGHA